MEWLVKTLVAAVISVLVPWLLKRILPEPATTQSPPGQRGTSFPWLRWIGLLALAGGVAGIVSGAMGLVLGGVANWAIFGAAIGIVQWFVLYRLVELGLWFALASVLGWAAFIFIQPIGHPTWALIGLLVGALQWVALRGKLKLAGLWIPINALAWFVAGMVGLAAGAILTELAGFGIAWVIGWTIVGGVGAGVLGLVLSWMWKRTVAIA
jgi:ABC-type multidrug transport system fused ATPase/permease subunit